MTDQISGRAWRALAVASLGTVLVGFNTTATNIALREIEAGLDATATEVGWGVAGYFIGTAALLPLAGRLADRVGRKTMFQSGLLLFAVSAVLSAVAPDVWSLNAARVLQAAAGGAILPSSLALVLPLFPEARRSGAVGLWSAAGPLSTGVAPAVAALLLSFQDWRFVYFISAPMAALMWIVGRYALDELPVEDSEHRLDIAGAVAGTAAVAAIVVAIMQGRLWGYWSVPTLAVALLGVLSFGAFVRVSLHHPAPLLNLHLLSRRGVWVPNVANFLVSVSSLAVWLVWPKFLSGVYGYSTLGVGLGVTIGPVCAGLSTVLFSRLCDRFGQKPFIRFGTFVQLCALSWQFWRLDENVNYWIDFAPGIMLFGLGWGMSTPLLNSLALEWVEEQFFGEANGLFNTVRYAAAAIGIGAVFAFLTVDSGVESLPKYNNTLLFFMLAAIAAFAVIWVPLGRNTLKTAAD